MQDDANSTLPAPSVTGGVNPRVDGEAFISDDKGAVEAPGLFNCAAIQKDGLSAVSSERSLSAGPYHSWYWSSNFKP